MRLFVYGTLLAGSDTAWAHWLRARMRTRMRTVRRASVPGRLLAIPTRDGCFPALVPGASDERVWGMVCDLVLRAGDLARLDRYEGREYRRAAIQVLVQGEASPGRSAPRRLAAQTYRWHARLPARALPIAGGNFLAWLEMTGARAYASRTETARFQISHGARSGGHYSAQAQRAVRSRPTGCNVAVAQS